MPGFVFLATLARDPDDRHRPAPLSKMPPTHILFVYAGGCCPTMGQAYTGLDGWSVVTSDPCRLQQLIRPIAAVVSRRRDVRADSVHPAAGGTHGGAPGPVHPACTRLGPLDSGICPRPKPLNPVPAVQSNLTRPVALAPARWRHPPVVDRPCASTSPTGPPSVPGPHHVDPPTGSTTPSGAARRPSSPSPQPTGPSPGRSGRPPPIRLAVAPAPRLVRSIGRGPRRLAAAHLAAGRRRWGSWLGIGMSRCVLCNGPLDQFGR
jgi:hypothetical protein